MFIEITRVYKTSSRFQHEMLLNVHTIMKVEPCDLVDDGISGVRIVLDRKNENSDWIILYAQNTYDQIRQRIKEIFNPSVKRGTHKKTIHK